MSNLSNRIRELRKSAGMTQEEFGIKFGVVKSTVSLYESGKSTPNDEIKKKMCEYFGVSMDYLLGIEHSEQEQEEPFYANQRERNLLEVYRNYEENGYSSELVEQLLRYFPSLQNDNILLNELDKKFLFAFRKLNEDNRDIILGEIKKCLKEQQYEASVAADSSKTGTDNLGK